MSTVIGLFATRNDLLDLLNEVEATRPIHYAEAGMFDSPELMVYPSALNIPSLGEIHVQESVQGRILLIADAAVQFVVRPVPQRRGGTRFAIDQKLNPDSVALFPGGQFDSHTLLAGNFGTCTDSEASSSLLGTVEASIRKRWVEIKSYAIGPEAASVLDAGGRLTANLRSPSEYDLQR